MRFLTGSFRRSPGLSELARVARMSPWHFHRRFKLCFAETPLQATARQQIGAAKRLMLGGRPLAKVAKEVGFSNQPHFTNRFKQMTGTTPKAWLKQHIATATSGRRARAR